MEHILCNYTGRRFIVHLTDVGDSCKLIQTLWIQTLFVQTFGTTASRGKGQGRGTTAVHLQHSPADASVPSLPTRALAPTVTSAD
jgi:hypothetical protein